MAIVFGITVVIFVLVCVALVFLVLIQNDKGGGLAGSIGGGLASAGSMLGSQDTANILTRGTTIFASLFMVLCLLLSLMVSWTGRGAEVSMLKKRAEQQQQFSPSSILHGNALPVQNAPAAAAPAQQGSPLPAAPIPVQNSSGAK